METCTKHFCHVVYITSECPVCLLDVAHAKAQVDLAVEKATVAALRDEVADLLNLRDRLVEIEDVVKKMRVVGQRTIDQMYDELVGFAKRERT